MNLQEDCILMVADEFGFNSYVPDTTSDRTEIGVGDDRYSPKGRLCVGDGWQQRGYCREVRFLVAQPIYMRQWARSRWWALQLHGWRP